MDAVDEETPSAAGSKVAAPNYWVGLGASAGGLEALTRCVAHLPAQGGCIYIIAQHMSPNHRSLMAEILGREAELPVCEAASNILPLHDHIYIIPPGQNLTLRDGRFSLVPTSPEVSPKPSINLLFQSLAENFGEHAIGIVLSGTGSDGTSGLRAIKAAGGIGMAQNPASAKYEGMPQAAIEAGVVDRVLDPADIGPELERLIQFSRDIPKLEHWEDRTPDLARIFEMVTERTRIDFSGYKISTVLRRLQRRFAATDCFNPPEYVSYCEMHPEELDTLARETLISVTEFFRDRDAFHALATRINDLVARKPAGEECRVWVVGCATGEEVYSIAILFAEALGNRLAKRSLQIFATDIDEIALAVARRAVYPLAALAEMPPAIASRYFTPVDGGMQVVRNLRECITFARQNLVADPPFLRLDIITCRNVLIYFNSELQAKALSTLYFGLRQDGVLFLGRSENANHQEELFIPLDRRNRLFRRRHGERRPNIAQLTHSSRARGSQRATPKAAASLERQFLEAVGQCYATRTILIDHSCNILYSRGEITPFIDLPQGSPQMNLAQIITPEFRGELATTLNRARHSNKAAKSRRKKLAKARGSCWQLTVHPIQAEEGSAENFLVVFDPVSARQASDPSEPVDSNELAATREHLQTLTEAMATTNEEMQALNEEIQAANEELQAANEELEASNEELQASNEELVAVNDESMVKSAELAAVNADFESVYNTLDFPVIVFDADLFVKRVNTSASRRFDLPPDICGQHLARLQLPTHHGDLAQRMAIALNEQRKETYTISEGVSNWQVFITPTLNTAGNAQSVVLVVIDHSQLAKVEARLQQSREELLSIMTHSPSLVCLKDTAGRYHFANPRWCAVFGLDAESIIGKTDAQLQPAPIARLLRERDLAVMSSLGGNETLIEFAAPTGKRFLQASSFPIFAGDETINFICTQAIDVTHKQKAEEQLRLAATVFDGTGEAIMVSSAAGQIITVNPAFTRITGYSPQEAIGQNTRLLKSERHEKSFFEAMWQTLDQSGFWQGEIVNKRKNGEDYPEWLTINAVPNNDGKIHNYVAMFSDISAIKTTQHRIEYLATHDELTALPNRTLLIDRLKHGITQAARTEHKLAVLFIDLDNFKHINDSLGHDVGDLMLKEAAHRLKTCVRDADTLARLGGDEFVALLVDVDIAQIRNIASRIVDFISASFPIRERSLFVSASIGIAIYPDDGSDSTSLLKNADTAMYRAKERGKNQYQFFADEMKVLALQRMTIESGLRLALDAGHLTIAYQPKIALGSLRLVGAEALLRWDDPSLGPVSPALFIPIAEHCGLINAVGDTAIRLVLDQMGLWQSEGLALCPISINVSSHQLRNAEFASQLATLIGQSGIPASLLCLEITESTLMQDIELSRQMLDQLTSIGVSISIDDFGTGYSSLAYLKRLPLSELKVDKSFVDNVDTDPDDRAITTAIINLAHALGLKVVAEGVERESHAAALIELGCESAQGNYFHHPLHPDKLAALMRDLH